MTTHLGREWRLRQGPRQPLSSPKVYAPGSVNPIFSAPWSAVAQDFTRFRRFRGELKPHVFSPASGAYVALLNRSWLSQPGHTAPLSPAGEPVVLSPLVIATWKPMAEALGWPQKALGWKDLIKVNADPKGWGAHGHPEWGPFKLGHTHPSSRTPVSCRCSPRRTP